MDEGVQITKDSYNDINITRIKITSEQGAYVMDAPMGDYSDISFCNTKEEDGDLVSNILTDELKRIASIPSGGTVLAVGLGNPEIPTDALGPATIEKLEATRVLSKLFAENFSDIIKVCAINPGVIGKTGIATQEVIEMFSKNLKPDLIVVIDVLDIHNIKHLGQTIMISNTGLRQNKRIPLNLTEEILGVTVVTIGVPFITNAVTIANDLMETLIPAIMGKGDAAGWVTQIPAYEERFGIIKTALSQSQIKNSILTLDNITGRIEHCSKIIAQGINKWLNASINGI